MKAMFNLVSVYKGNDGTRKDGTEYKGGLVFQALEFEEASLGKAARLKNIYYKGDSDVLRLYSSVSQLVGKEVFLDISEYKGFYSTFSVPVLVDNSVSPVSSTVSPVSGSLSQRVSAAA